MPTAGDWATWVQDALLVVTAVFAFLAFKKQSDQVAESKDFDSKQIDLLRTQLAVEQDFNKKQMEVLDLQVAELKAAADERAQESLFQRRAQASQVYFQINFEKKARVPGTISGSNHFDRYQVIVVNNSRLPVSNAVLRWHRGSAPWSPNGEPEDERQDMLLPGARWPIQRTAAQYDLDLPDDVSAVLEFRDAAGLCWRRGRKGELDEIG